MGGAAASVGIVAAIGCVLERVTHHVPDLPVEMPIDDSRIQAFRDEHCVRECGDIRGSIGAHSSTLARGEAEAKSSTKSVEQKVDVIGSEHGQSFVGRWGSSEHSAQAPE